MTTARICALLFAGFLPLYLFSFGTLPIPIPEYPTWAFYGDSRETILQGVWTVSNQFSIAKHPFYPLIGRPLYWLGGALFGGLDAPLSTNLALTLPSAVMGAAGVAAAYWGLIGNRPTAPRQALGFAVLYGLGTAPWMFGAFPDTYAFTAFFTILFLGLLARADPENPRHVFGLAAANALACWCSPQQLMLAVVPGVYWLLAHGVGAALVRRVVQYSVGLGVTWAMPYYLWLYFFGPGWRMPHQYMKENVEFSTGFIGTVLLDFHVFGLAGPATHPNAYTDPTFTVFRDAPLWWWAVLAFYLFFVARALSGVRGSTARGARYLPGVAVFMLGYSVFFMLFNAPESYLMAMTCTFVFVFGLHSAAEPKAPIDRALPFALAAVLALSNTAVLLRLRAEAIADPLGYQLKEEPPPEEASEGGTHTATTTATATTAP